MTTYCTYYVSGTGDDTNNGLAEGTAFRSLARAAYLMHAGDTVFMMDGVYDKGASFYNFNGSPTLWTTIKAYSGANPIIKTTGAGINLFSCSYVRIEGIDFEGNRENITLEYALQQKDNLNNPPTTSNGINIKIGKNSLGQGGTNPHHIVIFGNKVNNFPGGGIESSDSDYVTVERNIVSGNAWYSPYGCQGITTLRAFNSDNDTNSYKIIYKNNIVYNNKNLVPWSQVGQITEGHGLMLDTINQDSSGIPYLGKSLVTGNIAFNNGNCGINAYKANNVTIMNNTLYKNCTNINNKGEIKVNYSGNIGAMCNILYANDNQIANSIEYSTNVNFKHNLVYNSDIFQPSDNLQATGLENMLGKDPLFTNPSGNNFALQPTSPAIMSDGSKWGFEG